MQHLLSACRSPTPFTLLNFIGSLHNDDEMEKQAARQIKEKKLSSKAKSRKRYLVYLDPIIHSHHQSPCKCLRDLFQGLIPCSLAYRLAVQCVSVWREGGRERDSRVTWILRGGILGFVRPHTLTLTHTHSLSPSHTTTYSPGAACSSELLFCPSTPTTLRPTSKKQSLWSNRPKIEGNQWREGSPWPTASFLPPTARP